MSDTTISPNMNLPVPVPGTAPGPDWADDIVADMYAIDSHDHSNGKGVPVTPDGLNISADLPMGGNNLTTTRSVNFTAQAAPLALAGDLGCIYVSGADLYYNDEAGNQVRITQGGAVTGATGTITGLPSGTASASYSAGVFTFQSATNTPATLSVGPIITGAQTASPHKVTISASNSLATDYSLTWPLALPASTAALTVDASGNMATSAIVGGTFSPTITYTLASGSGGFTPTTTTSVWYYQRVGTIVFVQGSITLSGINPLGGTSTFTPSATLPIATASLASAGMSYSQAGGAAGIGDLGATTDVSNTGVAGVSGSLGFPGSATNLGKWFLSYSYAVS